MTCLSVGHEEMMLTQWRRIPDESVPSNLTAGALGLTLAGRCGALMASHASTPRRCGFPKMTRVGDQDDLHIHSRSPFAVYIRRRALCPAGACEETEALHAVMLPALGSSSARAHLHAAGCAAGHGPANLRQRETRAQPCQRIRRSAAPTAADLPWLVNALLPDRADGAIALPRAASSCLASCGSKRFLLGRMVS